jgi:hypothetical protein
MRPVELDDEPDDFLDLAEAAGSTFGFRDNLPDDEDWNQWP